MDLISTITDIHNRIDRNEYKNEAAVSTGIVQRLLACLQWHIYDPAVVYQEFPLEGQRVDYALCHPAHKARVIIEVKALGKLPASDDQLLSYVYKAGVPLAVLTDGRFWHFYYPAGSGTLDKRLFCRIDLVHDNPAEIKKRLKRYLCADQVQSGKAAQAAETDYRTMQYRTALEHDLPRLWEKLIAEKDKELYTVIAEKLNAAYGYRPEQPDVFAFLSQKTGGLEKPASPPATDDSAALRYGYCFAPAPFVPTHDGREVWRGVLEELAKRDSAFFDKFAPQAKGAKISYLAKEQQALNPERPDLVQKHSCQLSGGWWLYLCLNYNQIEQLVRKAAEIAGLEFGKDLWIKLKDQP
ncbi:MAG: hypothetical protein LBO67_09735 [Spirochaetaceae bacterium]|jgi:predicted type IV restriction endonuclease|nr:hypothetical protein [Spirochaetaceae bacterium]